MFTQIDPAKLLPFLSNDKMVVGNTLKLATLQSLGHMKFIDLPLNDSGIMEVEKAIKSIV
jgi:hypothetical protein